MYFAHTVSAIRTVRLPSTHRSLLGEPLALALFAALLLLFSAAFIPEARDTWRVGPYLFQTNNLEAANYIRETTPRGTRVAALTQGWWAISVNALWSILMEW